MDSLHSAGSEGSSPSGNAAAALVGSLPKGGGRFIRGAPSSGRAPFRSQHPHHHLHHHHPQHNQHHQQHGDENYKRLTATGCEYSIKESILARYRADLELPEGLARTMASLEDLWVPELLAPLSLSPLSVDEERIIAAGHFNPPHHSKPQAHHQQQQQQQQRGAMGIPRTGRNRQGAQVRGGAGPSSMPSSSSGFPSDSGEGQAEGGEDESILWNMPDEAGASLGTFDAQGNFFVSGHGSDKGGSKFLPPTTGSNGHRSVGGVPGHDRLPPPGSMSHGFFASAAGGGAVGGESGSPLLASPPFKIDEDELEGDDADENDPTALVTDRTKWMYRDPSGQVQGPFSTEKMRTWYERKYFPETLPMRRVQDILFEPLNVWKIKCGGKSPFDVKTTMKPVSIERSNPLFSTAPAISFGASAAAVAQEVHNKEDATANHTANIFAKLGISWAAAQQQQQQQQHQQQQERGSGSGPVVAPIAPTANTTKDPAVASSSSRTLGEDELSFFQQLTAKKKQSSVQSPPAVQHTHQQQHQPMAQPTSTVQSQPSTASAPSVIRAKTMVSAQDLKPAAAPSVGWAKVSSNAPVPKSLDEIMREEEEEESAAAASVTTAGTARSNIPSSGPKSFADLVRAGNSGSGAASAAASSPSVNGPPKFAPTSILSRPSSLAAATAATTTLSKTAGPQATPNANGSARKPPTSPAIPNYTAQTKAWCLAQLKPLEHLYDIQMCTILLMELRTPAEIESFIEDNLRSGGGASKVDLPAFARGLIERRFGPDNHRDGNRGEPAKDEEFVKVDRKSRSGKSK